MDPPYNTINSIQIRRINTNNTSNSNNTRATTMLDCLMTHNDLPQPAPQFRLHFDEPFQSTNTHHTSTTTSRSSSSSSSSGGGGGGGGGGSGSGGSSTSHATQPQYNQSSIRQLYVEYNYIFIIY